MFNIHIHEFFLVTKNEEISWTNGLKYLSLGLTNRYLNEVQNSFKTCHMHSYIPKLLDSTNKTKIPSDLILI